MWQSRRAVVASGVAVLSLLVVLATAGIAGTGPQGDEDDVVIDGSQEEGANGTVHVPADTVTEANGSVTIKPGDQAVCVGNCDDVDSEEK